MYYTAKFEPDDDGFLVTFPALPEAISGGLSEAEALTSASNALEVVLLTYASDGRDLPPDRVPRGAGRYVRVPVSAAVTAKLAFMEAFRASGMTRVALGASLGKAESEIRRMLDPYHATKLTTIEAALLVLGKRLVVTVEAA